MSLWDAISDGTYAILRNTGMSIEDILKMPSSRFWWLLGKISKEAKEREKYLKKK